MKELLKVKSIITLSTFATFTYLSVVGKIDPKDFMFILGMVATYYFNKDNTETPTFEEEIEEIEYE